MDFNALKKYDFILFIFFICFRLICMAHIDANKIMCENICLNTKNVKDHTSYRVDKQKEASQFTTAYVYFSKEFHMQFIHITIGYEYDRFMMFTISLYWVTK